MFFKRALPSPLTILMIVVFFAAIATWLMPAGEYRKLSSDRTDAFIVSESSGSVTLPFSQHTLDSLSIKISLQKFMEGEIRKPLSIPGTYRRMDKNPQGFLQVLQAPVKGIIESIDVALFVLMIGGFMFVFNETGAVLNGIEWLSFSMRGREPMLMVILIFVFAFLRASYGMEEETLVFLPILVPLFLAAGYDLLVPMAVVFAGTTVGGIAGFTNPFSTIIASNAAGVNWLDGIYERLVIFVLGTSFMSWYVLRYAAMVKKDPSRSLVLRIDGMVRVPDSLSIPVSNIKPGLSRQTKILLLLYILTFLAMIGGIVFLKWWTIEMSTLFLGSSILVAIITRMPERKFIASFVKGAENLLSVALIIGVARGITVILNDGRITDSILYYASAFVGNFPPGLFILLLLVFYFFFAMLISSSSGLAVLTMPIIGSMAIIINVPGREIVNSYLYGANIMCFIAPTGLVLPCLALVNVSYKVWIKFITPALIVLFVLCAGFLLVGVM